MHQGIAILRALKILFNGNQVVDVNHLHCKVCNLNGDGTLGNDLIIAERFEKSQQVEITKRCLEGEVTSQG